MGECERRTEKNFKRTVVVYFKVLSQNVPGRTQKTTINLCQDRKPSYR